MLKTLDWYIIKKFLTTFFFSVALIISVAIVIDLSEKIDDFIQNKASTQDLIFRYYIYFIPSFYNLFNNLFIFIAVIFFTSKMASDSEIIAILAGGVSFRRLLLPYMVAASFLGGISYFLNAWVIPYCDRQKVDFENIYINGRRNEDPYKNNVHRQLEPGLYMYLDNFNKKDSVGYKFTLEKFRNLTLEYKLAGERLSWNTASNKWQVENYVERDLVKGNVQRGFSKDLDITFNPQDFFWRSEDVGVFNNRELNEKIAKERLRGAEKIEYYTVEKYRRVSMPFSSIILTLIAVSIASRKVRGGVGIHIGVGMGIAFSFIFVAQFTFTFAHSGELHPIVAVWLPNIIYLLIGLVLFKKAPK